MWGQPPSAVQPGKARQPLLDLALVLASIDAFESAGKRLNESLAVKLAAGPIDPKLAATLNHGMMQIERNWLNPDGIPGRPWFKTHPLRRQIHLRPPRTPRSDGSRRSKRLADREQQAEFLQRAIEKNTRLLDQLNSTPTRKPLTPSRALESCHSKEQRRTPCTPTPPAASKGTS